MMMMMMMVMVMVSNTFCHIIIKIINNIFLQHFCPVIFWLMLFHFRQLPWTRRKKDHHPRSKVVHFADSFGSFCQDGAFVIKKILDLNLTWFHMILCMCLYVFVCYMAKFWKNFSMRGYATVTPLERPMAKCARVNWCVTPVAIPFSCRSSDDHFTFHRDSADEYLHNPCQLCKM
jgi:hypothetical protein